MATMTKDKQKIKSITVHISNKRGNFKKLRNLTNLIKSKDGLRNDNIELEFLDGGTMKYHIPLNFKFDNEQAPNNCMSIRVLPEFICNAIIATFNRDIIHLTVEERQ